jgi:hypothetical protein
MSNSEMLYLVLVVGVFVAYSAAMAYATWLGSKGER